jgi:hypothetical protein
MKNRGFYFSLLLLFSAHLSFAQTQRSILLKHIVTSVDSFQHHLSPEKIYIHTDRSYYFTGDTIWFKAYLFDRLSLSAAPKSQLLYIELNDDSLTNVKRFCIPMRYGIGWAQIPIIAKQFHEGTYTLRAYTNWMQNLSEDAFYKQRIYIGKPTGETWLIHSTTALTKKANADQLTIKLNIAGYNKQPVALNNVQVIINDKDKMVVSKDLQTSATGELEFSVDLKDKLRSENLSLYLLNTQKGERGKLQSIPLLFSRVQNIDLQFFPEGGNWVGGINSTIAFKAINEDGIGTNVKGAVYNSKDIKVADFNALHNGMGSFQMSPVTGEKYTARIDSPAGSAVKYALPPVKAEGTVMHIENNNQDDSLTVKLAFSQNIKDAGVYSLIGESRGFISYAGVVSPDIGLLRIPKNIFPSGIVHFSLLKDTVAVNERLVFINNQDNFKINITPGSTSYATKDSIALNLEVKDSDGNPVKGGSFSLAVTDDSRVKADTLGDNNIITSLLLKSDVKGYIENPSFYFAPGTANWKALDNLLLTQGWIGLDWKSVFKPMPPKYKAEQDFVVAGKVISSFKKPVEGAQILISSQKPAFIQETVTEKNGTYIFNKLPLLDTTSFFVMARTPKGKTMHFGQITVDKFIPPEVPDLTWPKVQPWYVNTDSITQKAVNATIEHMRDDPSNLKGHVLKEVVIKGKKVIPKSDNPNGSGNADMVFDEKDIKAAGVSNLYDFLKQQLPGFKVIMKDGFPALMFNQYYVRIEIDFGALPLDVEGPSPTVQEVIEALKNSGVNSFVGIEVMYNRKYTRSLPRPILQNVSKKGSQIMAREAFDGYGYKREEHDDYTGWRSSRAGSKDQDVAIVLITTRLKTGQDRNNNGSLNSVVYQPVYTVYARKFYSPKYVFDQKILAPDLRSTVYWVPDIVTDDKGKATVSFYAGDKPVTYSVILQGADLVNGIGSHYMKIKVR